MSDEKNLEEGSYIDAKGRTRWHENDEIALKFLELHAFLIIADYPEDHGIAISMVVKLYLSISRTDVGPHRPRSTDRGDPRSRGSRGKNC